MARLLVSKSLHYSRFKTKKLPTNGKPIPRLSFPFEEVMKGVLKVKPPANPTKEAKRDAKR